MNEYLKRKEESITSYSIRLYKNREAYGLTFKEIGKLLNEVTGNNYSEAKYRRPIQHFLEINSYLEQENPTGLDNEQLLEIEGSKLELEKEKIRMRDQRRIMNVKLREMARLEHLKNYLEETVGEIQPIKLPKAKKKKKSDNEAMVVISDEHIGMKIDSKFNTYNIEIAKERLAKLQKETMNKVEKEDIKKLYIAHLGDGIHGAIHTTARIESEENVIQQIITLAYMLESFVEEFVQKGIEVTFCSVAGNHTRALPNKKESLGTAENFERLLTVFLGKAFNQFDNYKQIDDEEGIIVLDIKGKTVVLVHADLDKGNGVVTKLNDMLNLSIDYIFTGHVHNAFYKEHGNAVQYGVGSLCGLDQYAISGRFSGRPSQLISTFNEDGIDYVKNLYFD